jgi:hypothetical protein
MTHARQDILAWSTLGGRWPSHEIGARSEQHDDAAVAWGPLLKAAVHPEAMCAAIPERSGRRNEAHGASGAQTTRLFTTRGVRLHTAREDLDGQLGCLPGLFGQVDSPQRSTDRGDVLRSPDLLVAEKLGPGAVGSIGQVLHGSFAFSVPPPSRLVAALPEEGEPPVAVSEDDHVAVAATSERASSRTLAGPVSVGLHSPRRSCCGVRFPSGVRGRSNHRRMPMSL